MMSHDLVRKLASSLSLAMQKKSSLVTSLYNTNKQYQNHLYRTARSSQLASDIRCSERGHLFQSFTRREIQLYRFSLGMSVILMVKAEPLVSSAAIHHMGNTRT
jgi:hypothetical protein